MICLFDRGYKIKKDRKRDDGPPIPKDIMLPLTEDGIRVYTHGGSVTVENCTVKKMRGGIRTYLSSGATVSNCTAIDCGLTNFNLPKRGQITGSAGNFAYAPLIDFPGSKSGQVIQLTILPSPHIVGPHNIAEIRGDNHSIIFTRLPGPVDTNLRPIVVSASDSTIRNETEYPIKLESSATKNTIYSYGPVTDSGSGNRVKQIEPATSKSDSPENLYRTWESKDGVKILAKLITKKRSSVTLGMIDGSQVTGRLRDLSKADRQYVADLDKAALPETPSKSSLKEASAKETAPSKASLRTWTSTSGHKIDARLLRKKRDSVTLEKADGSSVTVPLKKLSKADRDFVDDN